MLAQVNVNQNQHLMVWLRPAAQPSFRKLWAIIGVAIPAGECRMLSAVHCTMLHTKPTPRRKGSVCTI
jgi:hypothetical protein